MTYYYNQQVQYLKNKHLPHEAVISAVIKAKKLMDKAYDTEIDLTTVADASCFSRFHFVRLFKQCYGVTSHQYLTSVRIQRAKQLLLNGASVHHTCIALNYNSMASFSALFKRHTGHMPSHYLKKRNFR